MRSELEYVMEDKLLTARENLLNSPNFAYRITNTQPGKNQKAEIHHFLKRTISFTVHLRMMLTAQ